MAKDKAQNKSHNVYLVIADETEGFQLALRYVARLAQRNDARIAVLYVMDREDFQHWGGIEKRMQEETRASGEQLLIRACLKIKECGGGLLPALYLEEGGRLETIIDVIDNDEAITKLILGADPNSSKPGPLVSYFTGKGLSQLRVPLTIIPGTLTEDTVDELV